MIKKNILFLMGYYVPVSTANIFCCKNVIKELQKRGYRVIVICGSSDTLGIETVDGVEVHRVLRKEFSVALENEQSAIKRKMMLFGRMIHNVFLFPFFPNTEALFSYRLRTELKKVVRKEKCDLIIANFRPTATISALCSSTIAGVPKVGYYLDMLHAAPKPSYLSSAMYSAMCRKGDRKYFKKLDHIILPECGVDYYNSNLFIEFQNKIKYANFPIFKISSYKKTENSMLELVYAGYSNDTDRSPDMLLEIIRQLDLKNINIQFYGRTENEIAMHKYEASYPFFSYNGLVDKKIADQSLCKADYLIAFGNSVKGVVPSKIFELFGLKKRIIYVAPSKEDSALKYVEKYPDCCVLYRDEDFQNSKMKLESFIKKNPIVISDEYLLETYYSATPNAIADVLEKIIEK